MIQINKDVNLVAWNDETPAKSFFGGGHDKGLIAFDEQSDTGFLLTHSVPKYPSINDDSTINV